MTSFVDVETVKQKKRVVVWIGNEELMAVHTDTGVQVYSGMCPHQGGPLIDGPMTKDTLTCPWHGCTFELKEGRCIDLGACTNVSGMKLQTIPFEIKDGVIYVDR